MLSSQPRLTCASPGVSSSLREAARPLVLGGDRCDTLAAPSRRQASTQSSGAGPRYPATIVNVTVAVARWPAAFVAVMTSV